MMFALINRMKPVLLAMPMLLATAELVTAQDDEKSLKRSMESLDFAGSRPHRPVLVGNRLIWDDHALAGLCSELKGSFRKLAGRGEYICQLPFSLADAAAMQPEETD